MAPLTARRGVNGAVVAPLPLYCDRSSAPFEFPILPERLCSVWEKEI